MVQMMRVAWLPFTLVVVGLEGLDTQNPKYPSQTLVR